MNKRKQNKKIKNCCKECPFFGCTKDYSYDYDDYDEWCEAGKTFDEMNNCYHTLLGRRIFHKIWAVKQKYYDWKTDKLIEKDMDREYKERIELGMSEDEYEQWKYDEMMKCKKIK